MGGADEGGGGRRIVSKEELSRNEEAKRLGKKEKMLRLLLKL